LTKDHGSHGEALRCALAYRDEMCKSLPFPLHARVSQYLDGTHRAIQRYQLDGGPLKVRAQWVEFDESTGADRTRNIFRVVKKPGDYASVYAAVEAEVRPRIVREALRVAGLAALAGEAHCGTDVSAPAQALVDAVGRWHGREVVQPIPAELDNVVARCKGLFDGFQGATLNDLGSTLLEALDELETLRRRAPAALSNPPTRRAKARS
jgi:hypothetical protein